MDITITLYSTSDEPNKVEKTLSTNSFVITGQLKEEQDITAPAITIAIPIDENQNTPIDIFQFNYAYISTPFKRYYFITGFDTGLNNLVTIYFNEDYLMSWKTNIYNLTPLVTRQATEYNPMLFDGDLPIENVPYIDLTQYNLVDNTGLLVENKTSYSVSVFSKITSTATDINNGLSGVNQVYLFKNQAGMTRFMMDICKPSFWESLGNWFTNFSENILSLNLIPFDTFKTVKGSEMPKQNEIHFMANTYQSVNIEIYRIVSDNYFMFSSVIHFNPKPFNNFLDSLIEYSIYLPFLGEIKLDTNYILERNLQTLFVKYVVNPVNWICQIYITIEDFDAILTQETSIPYDKIIYKSDKFPISYELPIGSTNANERNLALLGYGIKATSSLLAAPFTGGASIAGFVGVDASPSKKVAKLEKRTQDKRLKVGGEKYNQRMSEYKSAKRVENIGKGISGASNILSDILPMTISQGSIINETQGQYNYYSNTYKIVLKIVKPRPNIPSNYYELYGGPCNLTVPLSELKNKGFTVCANLHMTGFPNCTLEEIDEIEDLLLSGVIL